MTYSTPVDTVDLLFPTLFRNSRKLFISYRIGHVPAATWMTHPPCSWHPGPARIPSDSDNLTLLYRPSVDCGLYRISWLYS
jgi:hypothetical protein